METSRVGARLSVRDDVDLSCGSGIGNLWETYDLGVTWGC